MRQTTRISWVLVFAVVIVFAVLACGQSDTSPNTPDAVRTEPVQYQLFFMEGNNCTQDVVGAVGAGNELYIDMTNDTAFTNDEARSLELNNVGAGTVIKVYDSPTGQMNDDWAKIIINKQISRYCIPSFEDAYEDKYVTVEVLYVNGIDGKLSSVEIFSNDLAQIIDISDYEKDLTSQDIDISSISISDNTVFLTTAWDSSRELVAPDDLHPISLLYRAEFAAYHAIYATYKYSDHIPALEVTVNVNSSPAYRVSATREQAYNFEPGSFSKPTANVDSGLLTFTAIEQRISEGFNEVEYLDQTVEDAIIFPNLMSVESELEYWLVSAEVTDISMDQGSVYVSLNLDAFASIFSGSDQTALSNELSHESEVQSVDVFYSLFTRFPWIEEIKVDVTSQGWILSSYFVNRVKFLDIGSMRFNKAVVTGRPRDVLDLLTLEP